jgi:hypothetical protein
MASNIATIKDKLSGGGARPNLFKVSMTYPSAIAAAGSEDILIKAAGLPSSNLGVIEVPVRGLILKVAGDRTFDTWTITVLNDIDFKIRQAFEKWMSSIRKLTDNDGKANPADYIVDGVTVEQLDRNENSIRKYIFEGVFPTNISQIDLSSDSTDTIEEFTVELQVQSYKISKSGGKAPDVN